MKNSQKGFCSGLNGISLCVAAGQSSLNFIFSLVEAHEGAHGDFGLKEGRPLSGQTLSHINSTSLATPFEQFMDFISFLFSLSLVINLRR